MPKLTIILSEDELATLKEEVRKGAASSAADAAAGFVRSEVQRLRKHEPEWRTFARGLKRQLKRSERRVDILKEMFAESVIEGKYEHVTHAAPFDDEFDDEEIPF